MSEIRFAVEKIKNSSFLVCFSGAGISAESGIPTFRDEDGLWKKYDPKIFDIVFFKQNPHKCWQYIYEIFYEKYTDFEPNFAHKALAKLEQLGYLKVIITQNIDNLHHKAGSKNVLEFHGTIRELICPRCRSVFNTFEIIKKKKMPPICTNCNNILKPNFVFFGEPIPSDIYSSSFEYTQKSDVMIVVGTSGEVYPAALLPQIVKNNGGTIIEINPKNAAFANEAKDIFIKATAVEAFQEIMKFF